MLRQRQQVESDTDVETEDRVLDDGRATVDDIGGKYQVPDDPRRIRDDGTFASDDDLIWGHQSSAVSPQAQPDAAQIVSTRRRITWGQVLILLAGAASLVFGIGAVMLAGLAGSVTEPVVQVFGFDHTPLLGLIEIAAGVVLVFAALVPGGRWLAGPIGVAAIVGGALIIAELDWTQTELAVESRFGWVSIAIGATAYLGAMAPTKRRVTPTR